MLPRMAASALSDLSGLGVLCLDDDPLMRTIVRSALSQRGCRDVVQSADGPTALELCRHRRFDLIICDLHMTPMSGLDFLHALVRQAVGKCCPTVMLSADNDPATIASAQELGVSAWLAKPISAHRLVERIGAVMGLDREAEHAGDQGRGVPVDRHYARLVADLSAFEEAIANLSYRERDRAEAWKRIRHLLHEVASHAGSFGYGLVADLSRQCLEILGNVDANPAMAAELQEEIGRVLATVATAMKRVAHNRVRGDGAEAGLRLLVKIGELVQPLNATLQAPSKP